MIRRAAIVALLALVWLPIRAGAWKNEKTHQELTDRALERTERMEQTLRLVYGLPEGLDTGLAPQRGFATDAGLEEVDADLGRELFVIGPPQVFRIPLQLRSKLAAATAFRSSA